MKKNNLINLLLIIVNSCTVILTLFGSSTVKTILVSTIYIIFIKLYVLKFLQPMYDNNVVD